MQNKSDLKKRAENFYILVKSLAQSTEISLEQFLQSLNKVEFQAQIQKELSENNSKYFPIVQKQNNIKIVVELNQNKEILFKAFINNENNDALSMFCNNLFKSENKNTANVKYFTDNADKNKITWIEIINTTK